MDILAKYLPAILDGARMTLMVAFASWTTGCVLGVFLGFAAARNRLAGMSLASFAFVLAAVPVLVLLFWFHYPLQAILGIVVDPFITTVLILSLVNTVMVAEIVRDTEETVAREFLEAAFVHGVDRHLATRRIELPLVLRLSISRIVSTQVLVLHMTLFASLISLEELFRVAQRINAIEYQPVEIYSLLALAYVVLSVPLIAVSAVLRKRFGRDLSER